MNREEAIARIREHKIIHKMNEPRAIYISEALDMGIKALENQKTGHWVEIDDYPHEDFECDCCGGKVYGTEEPYEEYKYCPNCGAKMKGE